VRNLRREDKDAKQLGPEEPIAKIIKYLGGVKSAC